jgi:hypothetical protein
MKNLFADVYVCGNCGHLEFFYPTEKTGDSRNVF